VNLRSVRGSGYLFSADQAGTGEPLEEATDEGAALAS